MVVAVLEIETANLYFRRVLRVHIGIWISSFYYVVDNESIERILCVPKRFRVVAFYLGTTLPTLATLAFRGYSSL